MKQKQSINTQLAWTVFTKKCLKQPIKAIQGLNLEIWPNYKLGFQSSAAQTYMLRATLNQALLFHGLPYSNLSSHLDQSVSLQSNLSLFFRTNIYSGDIWLMGSSADWTMPKSHLTFSVLIYSLWLFRSDSTSEYHNLQKSFPLI